MEGGWGGEQAEEEKKEGEEEEEDPLEIRKNSLQSIG